MLVDSRPVRYQLMQGHILFHDLRDTMDYISKAMLHTRSYLEVLKWYSFWNSGLLLSLEGKLSLRRTSVVLEVYNRIK